MKEDVSGDKVNSVRLEINFIGKEKLLHHEGKMVKSFFFSSSAESEFSIVFFVSMLSRSKTYVKRDSTFSFPDGNFGYTIIKSFTRSHQNGRAVSVGKRAEAAAAISLSKLVEAIVHYSTIPFLSFIILV